MSVSMFSRIVLCLMSPQAPWIPTPPFRDMGICSGLRSGGRLSLHNLNCLQCGEMGYASDMMPADSELTGRPNGFERQSRERNL